MADMKEKLSWLGLTEKTLEGTLSNAKLSAALCAALDEAGVTGPHPKGSQIYSVVTSLPADAAHHRSFILRYVVDGKFHLQSQVDAALAFAKKNKFEKTLDAAQFEAATGVGLVVTEADIRAAVADVIAANKDELLARRYHFNVGPLMRAVTERLKFPDPQVLRSVLDESIVALLGPKTEADSKPLEKPKKEPKPAAAPAAAAGAASPAAASTVTSKDDAEVLLGKWPKPDENPYNPPELLKAHLARTGGQVRTRFPPEPNGYLHVGHAKAMFIDFGQALLYNGVCFLRYDDTNPEAEKQEYIDAILRDVQWMGYTPFQVTYASDHFDRLYDLAVELIKRGHAYVCHQTSEEIAYGREHMLDSPWRNRSVEENLREFEKMRLGMYAEGEATLRMKMDMKHPKTCMRDLVAYRVLMKSHPRTGDKWCIYPSYDYTHCLCDSFEDITHSLCTREFNIRRESYYWVLEKLDLYRPIVWEYSRLNLSHTIVSKRVLKAIVAEGYAREWDDPRMPTLMALRRKGYTPSAIRAFCAQMGASAADSTTIPYERLENSLREELDATARRTFIVLDPIKVTITNYPEGKIEEVAAPDFPAAKDRSTKHMLPFSRVVYIDRNDFRLKDDPDYKGLAPNKSVMLKYAYVIKCTKAIERDGVVVELEAEYDPSNATKVKGHIHWVGPRSTSDPKPATAEVRLYEHLFLAAEMAPHMKTWRSQINPKSETIYPNALVDPTILSAPVGTSFQAERVGFFCVDRISTPEKMVLIRSVTLKESYPKFAAAAAGAGAAHQSPAPASKSA